MRVMFAIWPAPAHLYPLVPLAWALRSAGHEVVIASHPAIADSVAAMGLTPAAVCTADSMPVPMGPGRAFTEERAAVAAITKALDIDPAQREHWNVFSQFYLPAMWDFNPYRGAPEDPLPAMDGLVDFIRGWAPDLVMWDPCFAGAAVAARACGVVHARWWTAPDVVGWSLEKFLELTGRPGAPRVDNPLVETIRPMAQRYGVDVDTETLLGQWTLNPMPPVMDLPVSSTLTIPVRWIPHSTQEVMPDWLYPKPERPRVALSLGLSSRQFLSGDWPHVPVLLEAMSELDIEVVATLNEAQLVGVKQLPDNVRVVDFVPLNQLVPTCAALIHHGGLGTAAAAAAAGVPQIVADFVAEDISATTEDDGMGTSRFTLGPATARYVTERGAGLVMDVSRPDVDQMRKQLVRVLTEPEFQEGAGRVRDDLLATPSPSEIVPILERLTEQHRIR